MVQERRRYYRIEEEVLVSLVPINTSDIDQRVEDFWSNEQAISIRDDYNHQISQHISDRRKIEESMPELGRYLSVLQKQVDRLSENKLVDEDELSMKKLTASLSAQGISFVDDESRQRDDRVELNLKLLPSGLRIVIIARVVLVETGSELNPGDCRISLDFEHLHEADREVLIKHLHGKQMESLSGVKES